MDMAACPYTDFSCAGKKRGVARRNPDARKKLVKTKPEIIAEIRDTPPGFCVKEGMPQEEVKSTEGIKGSRTSEKWRSSRGSKKNGKAKDRRLNPGREQTKTQGENQRNKNPQLAENEP